LTRTNSPGEAKASGDSSSAGQLSCPRRLAEGARKIIRALHSIITERSVAVGSETNECGRAKKIFEYCSVWPEKSAKRLRLSPCRPLYKPPIATKRGFAKILRTAIAL
jgi:hypothetical protein